MYDFKPMDTPIKRNMSLSLDMGPKTPKGKEQMSKVTCSNAVGCLMYANDMHTSKHMLCCWVSKHISI